jgi:hypothetical protein
MPNNISNYRRRNIQEPLSDYYYENGVNLSNNRLNIKKDLNAKSYLEHLKHQNDHILNVGFDFREQILMRTLSPVLFFNTKNAGILVKIDSILSYLVDHVKSIKKTFNCNLPQNYRDFN